MSHLGARRSIMRIALLVLLLVLAAGAGYRRFTHTPLWTTGAGSCIEVPHGSSFGAIIAKLQARGISDGARGYWWLLALRLGVNGHLHAGEYALPAGMRPADLLQAMARGKVCQHRFTLVEGWSFKTLREALAHVSKLGHPAAALSDAELMRRIGAPDLPPEGQFMPETYAYVWGDSDLDLLRRAYHAQQQLLARLWPARVPGLPLATPQQALILASLVEKETGRADERARIAGVFVHRLRLHMLLQTDPTVIYALGDRYRGHLRKDDLAVASAYNTYLYPGLPPTPIAMPGRAALLASLHPQVGDALYFVARGDGGHVFARTLAEQDRHIACYQLKRCR